MTPSRPGAHRSPKLPSGHRGASATPASAAAGSAVPMLARGRACSRSSLLAARAAHHRAFGQPSWAVLRALGRRAPCQDRLQARAHGSAVLGRAVRAQGHRHGIPLAAAAPATMLQRLAVLRRRECHSSGDLQGRGAAVARARASRRRNCAASRDQTASEITCCACCPPRSAKNTPPVTTELSRGLALCRRPAAGRRHKCSLTCGGLGDLACAVRGPTAMRHIGPPGATRSRLFVTAHLCRSRSTSCRPCAPLRLSRLQRC